MAKNLFDTDISQEMFRELYFFRWPVELKYKELKSRLEIEEFNGATASSTNKYRYPANRAFIIERFKK
jgi:hypothetical protein